MNIAEWRGCLFAMLISSGASVAIASPVFLETQGGSTGQAFTFIFGETCYAFTAKHVMGNAKQAELISSEAQQLSAERVGDNAQLDLTLLRVSASRARNLIHLCEAPPGVTLHVPDVLTHTRYPLSLVLQRVSSHAGGVDYASMKLVSADENSPLMVFQPKTDLDAIRQGDSGAALWSSRRERAGKLDGDLIGMVVSVSADKVNVLRIDTLYSAIHSILWPISEHALKFSPLNARMIALHRGSMLTESHINSQTSIFWRDGVATINMTFDLGDRDTIVRGIDIRVFGVTGFFGDPDTYVAAAYKHPQIIVQTSPSRPDERTVWEETPCGMGQRLLLGCDFQDPKVIRGARIQFTGALPNLSGVTFRTVPPH